MNSHSQETSAAAAAAASMSGVSGTSYSNSVFERLLQQNRTTGGTVGSSQVGVSPSPLAGDAGSIMNQQDLLSMQRDRSRMLAALQQQQRQLAAASMAAARGLPVLHQNISQDFRGAQRFMVDDFAGAGNLLSRSEQDMLVSRYPSMAVTAHMGLSGHTDLDFGNASKFADLLLAKQAFNEANKPRTTRLPCQARGMKADHNSSTAYFEIPEDARHGQHLLCSQPACRAAGIKFRYCLHCRKPVTKQNFRSRHLHADLDPNSNEDATVSNSSKLSTSSPDRKRSSPSANDMVDSSTMRCLPVNDVGVVDDGEERRKMMKTTSPAERVGTNTTSELNPDSLALGAVSRRRRWTNLLKERPTDLDTMDKWLSNVISISDPRSSMNATNGLVVESKTGKPAIQESRWIDLFEQRPAPKEGDAEITNWLIQVLQTSCTEQQKLEEALRKRKIDNTTSNSMKKEQQLDLGSPK